MARELDDILLGDLLKHAGKDLLLLGGTLNSIAVLLDEDVSDVDPLLDRVVVENLEVLGILGSEGIIKLLSEESDMSAVKNGVTNSSEPSTLIERTRIVARNLRRVVVEQMKIPNSTDDTKSGLAVLDHDGFGETMKSFGVMFLPVEEFGAEGIDTVLQSAVVEFVIVAKFVVETSVTTG